MKENERHGIKSNDVSKHVKMLRLRCTSILLLKLPGYYSHGGAGKGVAKLNPKTYSFQMFFERKQMKDMKGKEMKEMV